MHVTIIGAGPRGLVTLERLIERFRHDTRTLNISIIDPYGIGGRVWRVDQAHELLMNSNVNFISMFTDSSVQIDGPIVSGPSLFEWAKSGQSKIFISDLNFENRHQLLQEINTIQENDYASRSLFGAYQKWFYESLIASLPASIHVELINKEVNNIIKDGTKYVIELENQLFKTDASIMSLGHIPNQRNSQEQAFTTFANNHQLTYVTPSHPQEYDFSNLKAGETIILRGLGLSFFDAITLLTQGRNGHFTHTKSGKLIYHPSGTEPKIIAGSRRGLPYHGKGTNQKSSGENESPHFFTANWFQTHTEPGSLSGPEFINLVHKEIEYIYYKRLIQIKYPTIELNQWLRQFSIANNPSTVIQASEINPSDYWNWDRVLGLEIPANGVNDYLLDDIANAKLGNKTGPIASAFDMFRDIRDIIRQIVNLKLLSDDDYQKYFLQQFKGENSFLSVGPPESRIEELLALINAGIVTILKPEMEIETDNKLASFVTYSALQPSTKFKAKYLIEARLPAINVEKTTSNLIKGLLQSGLAKEHSLTLADKSKYKTGAIDTTSGLETLDNNLFFWGVQTEGKRWFTTVSPRPHNNDGIFVTADNIVKKIQDQ